MLIVMMETAGEPGSNKEKCEAFQVFLLKYWTVYPSGFEPN